VVAEGAAGHLDLAAADAPGGAIVEIPDLEALHGERSTVAAEVLVLETATAAVEVGASVDADRERRVPARGIAVGHGAASGEAVDDRRVRADGTREGRQRQ